MCPGGVVEDENHFLLECPWYTRLRQELVWAIGEDAEMMEGVMAHPHHAARYVTAAWSLRQKIIKQLEERAVYS